MEWSLRFWFNEHALRRRMLHFDSLAQNFRWLLNSSECEFSHCRLIILLLDLIFEELKFSVDLLDVIQVVVFLLWVELLGGKLLYSLLFLCFLLL